MSASLPNNLILGIMFKRLRREEGLQSSKLMSVLEPELIFSILLNARCKQDMAKSLTNLEEVLKNEAGNYIQAYINEKWEQIKTENGLKLPYPEYETKTISEVLGESKLNA